MAAVLLGQRGAVGRSTAGSGELCWGLGMLRCSKSFVLLLLYCCAALGNVFVSVWYTSHLRATPRLSAGGRVRAAGARLACKALFETLAQGFANKPADVLARR